MGYDSFVALPYLYVLTPLLLASQAGPATTVSPSPARMSETLIRLHL